MKNKIVIRKKKYSEFQKLSEFLNFTKFRNLKIKFRFIFKSNLQGKSEIQKRVYI